MTLLGVALAAERPPDTNAHYVDVLYRDNFDSTIRNNKYILVDFYANWCSHCIEFEPEYNRLGKLLYEKGTNEITI